MSQKKKPGPKRPKPVEVPTTVVGVMDASVIRECYLDVIKKMTPEEFLASVAKANPHLDFSGEIVVPKENGSQGSDS